jgi:low temperature requirement protein LtrA
MRGRDPHEAYRVATPLELLFDLTFVISFGLASAEFARALVAGQYAAALLGFGFASLAICWAWINFSWFASAYDTDDWIFRLVTMVQMIGVIVLAIGLPRMFASIEHGVRFDNSVMVLGYVIMRIAMVFQWVRAARQDPARRRICLTYAVAIAVAQVGWVAFIFLSLSLLPALLFGAVLLLVELAAPALAERKDGGTPWHAHHIAERHSLFAVIALGEGIVGTVATLLAVVQQQGWTLDAALACVAGMGLTFGIWWVYYLLPSAQVLHEHRNRALIWGSLQTVIVVSIVAAGAGLQVAAYFIQHKTQIGPLATVLAAALPVSVFLVSVSVLYEYLVRRFDPLHPLVLAGSMVVVAAAVFAAMSGLGVALSLVILMLAPAATVVGYEIHGHRDVARALGNGATRT